MHTITKLQLEKSNINKKIKLLAIRKFKFADR
jgi:hypothetical protein